MKFNWKMQFLFFITLFQTINVYPQQNKEIVAKAGDIVISKDEFCKRYEFTPHLKTKTAYDSVTTKRDFIYTLVAEKLLAQAARLDKVDKSHDFDIMMRYLRNIYLRDALYKAEVKDKIVIPDSDLVKGKKRILKSFRTKFIFSTDEQEIKKIFLDISNGASFDSLLAERPESSEQKETEEVTFGTMNEKLEDVIFNLVPGSVTVPIQLQEGWYICKVFSVTEKIFLDDSDKRNVEKVVAARIEDKIYQAFYKNFFKGVKISADRELFARLVSAIYQYVKENETLFKEKRNNKIRLVEKDIYPIEGKISKADLNLIFIKFPENPVLLSQFLDHFMLEGFEIEKNDEVNIKTRLNSFVKNFIQNELLVREALRRGYDKLPEVASELKMWQDFYLSRLMMKKIFVQEPVTDDEAYNFFVKSNQIITQPDEVKIAEILVGDLSLVENILNEIDKGKDFKELAAKYTIRDSLRTKGGVFDYFTVTKNGDLGKIAQQMKIGEVYGPIKIPEGYSIIKLLDKKEGKKIQFEKFEEAKEEIKDILRTDKMYKKLDDETAKLAINHGVEINESVLNSIKVTKINMMVFRRFGFGGQLVAAPFSPDFSSWFRVYEQLKKKLSL